MNTKRFYVPTLLVTALLTITGCSTPNSSAKAQPNILFIMSDDHAYQAIGAYGSVLNETPNIDRLANEGMRFDKAFVTNSICSPSRAVVLTGKHSHLNGVRGNFEVFDGAQQTFPKLLQQAGYQTAMIGKWHLKSEPTGFDYWRVLPGQGHYYSPDFRTPQGTVTVKGYVTDVIGDMAIDWLDKKRDTTKPFLMMYHNKAPHREWLPAQRHFGDYMDKPLPEPKSLFDDYSGRGQAAKEQEMEVLTHMGLTGDSKLDPEMVEAKGYKDFRNSSNRIYKSMLSRMTDEQRKSWHAVYGPINDEFKKANLKGEELLRWKYQRYMQDYLGTINSVDENVGRVLDYLDRSGLADNTIVVYTSDQGFYLGEHGWFDKRFMYEESFRTPLVVRWPGKVKPGSVNSDLVQNLDFAETFLQAAGVEVPADMQGKSLVPLLEGNNDGWREAIFYHYYAYPSTHAVKRHYGIRTQRFKLIHFYHDVDEWELYDLEADPQEMNNVFSESKYATVSEELRQKLDELRELYGDSDQLANALVRSDAKRNGKH
jgi:arylsulfatase A-like enzyme